MSIQTNIQEVRQRIAAACGECGLDPVFTQHVDPSGDGLPAGGGVIHLAG